MEGAGEKVFCSGGDMRGLYDANYGVLPKSYQPTYTGTLYKVDNYLHNMS